MTSVVEGEFPIDGVQTCHMFMLRGSSPADVAELILHHKVKNSCGALFSTDVSDRPQRTEMNKKHLRCIQSAIACLSSDVH